MPPDETTSSRVRLHVFLARAGRGSRRAMETAIAAGRVSVNGKAVTVQGAMIDPSLNSVTLDGRPVPARSEETEYIILNKPPGVFTTARDEIGRRTVLDLLTADFRKLRVYPVGRLDRDSRGLVLLTNDGELTHQLTHPSFEHEREYVVEVTGRPSETAMAELRSRIDLQEGPTSPAAFDIIDTKPNSTQDADSEGEEGKFYIWEPSEIKEVLGDDAEAFMKVYDVSDHGNFEGHNILNLPLDFEAAAHALDMPTADLDKLREESRKALLERRDLRIKPGLDDKVLTAWNGLMLAAFAEAAKAFDNPDYLAAARQNARFILTELGTPEGRLRRTWKDGRASLNGYLEDYSYLLEGLLKLYEATFEPEWFVAARDIADVMIERFADPDGGFFDTSDDHERLVTRPKNVQDNATPSGSSMAATALLRLSGLTGDGKYADAAESGFNQLSGMVDKHPTAFGQWLNALDYYFGDPVEVAIVGDLASEQSRALLGVVFEGFRPNVVVAAGDESDDSPIPLLTARPRIDGAATAYVCRNFTCNFPVTGADDLRSQL